MKRKIALLLAMLFCFLGFVSGPAEAGIVISIGDQPYYSRGPGFWSGGVYWVWISGHWRRRFGRRYWVHGHYAPR